MLSNPPQSRPAPTDFWQSLSKLVALQNQSPPLQPTARDQLLPLSFPQERLWWISQLNPEGSSHNLSLAYRIIGPLQVEALQHSLQTVIQRHEVLRTYFPSPTDQPVQQIENSARLDLQVVDLRSLGGDAAHLEARALATTLIQRPFDLTQDLPIRAALLHLDQQEYGFLLVIHHIAFDGWSEGLLCQDLAQAYAAFTQQQQPDLAPLPIQYGDFAAWQRQWLQDELQTTLLNYWTNHLDGHLAVPNLPVQPSTATSGQGSASQTLVLDRAQTKVLRTFSQQRGATLFVTLLTAFKVLLHHYCEQDVLMVCTPVANRNRSELKTLIGYFVNLLLLQTDVSGDPSFDTALQQVRQTVTQAFAHQDLPVQQVVSQFKGTGAVSRVMFALQNTPQHPLTLTGVTVEPWSVGGEMADFDLFLSITDLGETLKATVKYNATLFEVDFIQTLLEHFRQVLQQAIIDAEQPLSAYLTFTPVERQQLRQQRQTRQALTQVGKGSTGSADMPRDEVETALVEIWEALLGIRPRRQDNFFELGGQSLVAVQLLGEIETRFGKKLPLNTLLGAATVEQLAEVIRESEATQLWPVLVPLRTGAAATKPPLFGIHGIGGGVLFYREIAESLDADIPVYGLQSLGMDGIQTPLERVEDMATLYIKEMRQVQRHGPYHLAGYSFGGFIALEMAVQLQAVGETVAFLAMLDAPTPDLAQRQPSLWEYASTHLINLWREAPDRKLKYVLGRMKWLQIKQKVQNRDYEAELQRQNPNLRMYQVLKPNYRAADRYVAKPYEGHISVFRATLQTSRCARYPYLGWDAYARTVEAMTVPGDHYSLVKKPNAKVLGTLLNDHLKRAYGESAKE